MSEYIPMTQNEEWVREQLIAIRDMQSQLLINSKPILTMDEAARMLSISSKRLTNILYEEKARHGRFPDFVCNAGGILSRRIVRDELLEWVKMGKRRKRKVRGMISCVPIG